MTTAYKAALFGIEGVRLSDEEKTFFMQARPVGFILFARNCQSPQQVRQLIADLRALNEAEPLILIDQEGGRVARLKPPYWRSAPPAGVFAAEVENPAQREQLVYANARLIARELYDLGITVDCAPLADVPVPGSHDIIGDRAYSGQPHEVARLAGRMAQGLLDGGVLPVLKHIPGHGRAHTDSHEELPVVDASLAALRASDFIPFHQLRQLPIAMTAHILYTALDEERPATLSPAVITLIRQELGFDGLLMSDDVSMKALKGDLGDIARASLAAGCDLVLHCNGKMEEMRAVAEALPSLTENAAGRLQKAQAQLRPPLPFDYDGAQTALDACIRQKERVG